MLVFPELKTDIQEEMKIIEALGTEVKNRFTEQRIPKPYWKEELNQIFIRFDGSGNGSLDKQEFWLLISHIGGSAKQMLTKKLFQILFMSVRRIGCEIYGFDFNFTTDG